MWMTNACEVTQRLQPWQACENAPSNMLLPINIYDIRLAFGLFSAFLNPPEQEDRWALFQRIGYIFVTQSKQTFSHCVHDWRKEK